MPPVFAGFPVFSRLKQAWVDEQMTRELVIQCTTCAHKMKVNAPKTRAQVTCPICTNKSLLDPDGKIIAKNGLSLEEFGQLPPPIMVVGEVSRPATSERVFRRAAKKAYRETNRDAIRKSRIKKLQTFAVAVFCLVIVGTLGTLAYKSLSQVSREEWAEVLPGMETPDKILNQYASICARCQSTCDSIIDTSSGEKAAPQFRLMAGSLAEVPGLVEKMIELAPNQVQSISPSRLDELSSQWKQTQECVQIIRSNKRAYSPELFKALIDFAQANDAAAQAILSKWNDTPNNSSENTSDSGALTLTK